MRKIRSTGWLSLSALILITYGCAHPSKTEPNAATGVSGGANASMEIPDRREFPVNPAISPCVDFFEYSCSKVKESFKLRDDRSRHIFAFSDSNERLLEKKKAFMATLDQNQSLSPRGQQLKDIYLSCTNTDARVQEEKTLIASEWKTIQGVQSHADFHRLLNDRIFSMDPNFVHVDDVPNQEDPSQRDLLFIISFQNLPERSYYDKPELIKDYQAVIEEFFSIVGAGKISRAEARARAEKVVQFERDFAQKYPLPAEFRERLNQKREIKPSEIAKKYSHWPVEKLLARVPDRTRIRNIIPETMDFLETQLSAGDLATLKDAYLYSILGDELDEAYPQFYAKVFEFKRKHLGGPDKRPDLKERCTKFVSAAFDREVDAELLPKIFPDFPEKKFAGLALKVRNSIIEGLKSNHWLSPKGKQSAIDKIKKARLQLVKPRNDREWDFMPIQKYSPTDFIANKIKVARVQDEKTIRELKEKRDPNRWSMGPLTVNAYYSAADNKFVMPIGILQYPFYDPSLPDEVNLGSVGAVIGHELGHAIDDQGSKYDDLGRMHEWMTQADLANFKKHSEKLIGQFNGIGHNGVLTLGENIGDLVGVSFAYHAAFPKQNVALAEKNLEAEQKFFLQYARVWCGVIRPGMREQLLKVDPHSVIEARVNQQVRHQTGFQDAYQCKAGDPMYLPAAERIRIW